MALKGDREIYITNIAFICDTAAVEGQVLIVKASQPSGRGVGQGINESAPVATLGASGTPASGAVIAGLLLTDVENIDQTRVHRNYQKTTQVVGENVALVTLGKVWTDQITGTPVLGDTAYLGANGKLQNTQVNAVAAVGSFETSKDTDGFAKVFIKLV